MSTQHIFLDASQAREVTEEVLWKVVRDHGNLSRSAVEGVIRTANRTRMIASLRDLLSLHHKVGADVILAIVELAGDFTENDGAELVRHIAGLMRWGTRIHRGKFEALTVVPPAEELKKTLQHFYERSLLLYNNCLIQRDDFLSY